MSRVWLQIALDGELAQAQDILRQVAPYIDVVEIGTPLIYREGVRALALLRQSYPDKRYVADLKIMDAGDEEAMIAFEAGANRVTILGVTQDVTVTGAVRAARRSGGEVMADLLQVADPVTRGRELLALGVDVLCVHTAYDVQQAGASPLDGLRRLRQALPEARLAVAGGITLETVEPILTCAPEIVIVGGGITRANDPVAAAHALYKRLENT